MTLLPTPSRRVLTDLAAAYLADPAAAADHIHSPVRRAFVALTHLLDAQAAALTEIDRIEAAVLTEFGHPRVALPTRAGAAQVYAADVATIRAHLGSGPAAGRLIRALRRRWSRSVLAGTESGLPAAEAREQALAAEISATAAALLLAPVVDDADLARKLIVLAAMTEAGPADGITFPACCLRTLLADIAQLRRRQPP